MTRQGMYLMGLPARLYNSLVLVIPSSPLLILLRSSSPPNDGEWLKWTGTLTFNMGDDDDRDTGIFQKIKFSS